MRRLLVVLLLLPLCHPARAGGEGRRAVGYLTGPSSRDPLDIALDYASRTRSLGARAVDGGGDYRVAGHFASARSGATHIVLRQRIDGIEVWNGDLAVNVSRNGRVINAHDGFVERSRASLLRAGAVLDSAEALRRAAEQLGLGRGGLLEIIEARGGAAREVLFAAASISHDPIPVKLVYASREGGGAELAWNMVIREPRGRHWWDVLVDAETGNLLEQVDWVFHDSYLVFPLPLQDPDDGPRSTELDPADPVASSRGWHDDGTTQFFGTIGNNASAQEDIDGNNQGGFQPQGGVLRTFEFPLEPGLAPEFNQSAAITNLFYWTNLLHDLHYQYGFDEASGNFQENNFGRGGVGGDAVFADAQDGADFGNASFFVAPEGVPPTMEMYLWQNSQTAVLRVSTPATVAGEYRAGSAEFGPVLTTPGLSGSVAEALDAVEAGGTDRDACSPIANALEVAGKLVLVDRGLCLFVDKVENAQRAGASGVIIANNAGDEVITMAGTNASITIPSLFVAQSHGAALRAQIGAGLTAELAEFTGPDTIDSSLGNDLIIHEYGHGVSSRLTGGAFNASCLAQLQSDGMSEGWSDYWSIALTQKPGDARAGAYPVGTFVLGRLPTTGGLRNFPYSTNLAIEPQTYADIATTNRPHGVGEVWAAALWEMHWNLIDAYGFDPDLYAGNGGNNRALQLVMDGLKLQPCNPSFLDGRDAILSADWNDTGGADRCAIWRAFAKRGMGVDADDGGGAASDVVTESFAVPIECPEPGGALRLLAAFGGLALVAAARRPPAGPLH